MRKFVALALIPLVLAAAGCGGGGGGGGGGTPPPPPPGQTIAPPGPPNVEKLIVDQGPAALTSTAVNTAYLTVTVCVPGSVPPSANCANIDHVEVDTGSVGLRILADASTFNITLPAAMSGTNPLAECLAFADGASWGALATADIYLQTSGEKVANATVQIIGGAAGTIGANVPAACNTPAVMKTENTVADFGANGILGVGPFINDCNSIGNCSPGPQSANYYSCPTPSSCAANTAALSQQVPNPVTLFAKDNNGVIVELPAVSAAGQADPSGSLVFGIGTESNNALGSATMLSASPSTGNISATLGTTNFANAYLDSGSNANFFADSALTVCPSPNNGFYCPATVAPENATLQGAGGTMLAADFSVDNANNLFAANPTFTALPDLSGPNPDSTVFDLGLSFFFGRNVFTGFEDVATNAAPYFAY